MKQDFLIVALYHYFNGNNFGAQLCFHKFHCYNKTMEHFCHAEVGRVEYMYGNGLSMTS